MALEWTFNSLNMKNIAIHNVKMFFLVITLAVSVSMVAQTKEIRGKVIDSENNQPIEGVVVINEQNDKYTVTNEEGDFQITIDTEGELMFNHINYQTTQLVVKDDGVVVKLEISNTELEEIVVFNRPLYDVFSTALKNASKTVEKGDLYKTYVREFNIVNKKQVNVADGLVDFYVKKPTTRPLTDVLEHRVFRSAKDIDKDTDIEGAISVIGGDVRDALIGSVNLSSLEKILKDTDSYEFITRRKVEPNKEEKVILEFAPKEGLKGWRYEQGYVVFDESLSKVLEYKYKLSDVYKEKTEEINMILARVQIYDYGKHAVFLNNKEAGYRLFYSTSFADVSVFVKKYGKHAFSLLNEVVVDKVIKNVEIPKQKQFRGSLFNEHSNYKTEFWKNRNVRPLSVKEQEILNQLEEIKN